MLENIKDFSIDRNGYFFYKSDNFGKRHLAKGVIMAFTDVKSNDSIVVSDNPFNMLYLSSYHGCIRSCSMLIYTEEE